MTGYTHPHCFAIGADGDHCVLYLGHDGPHAGFELLADAPGMVVPTVDLIGADIDCECAARDAVN